MSSQDGGAGASELGVLAAQFQELVRSMADGEGRLEIEPVLPFARVAIPGADHAAITVEKDGSGPETIAASGELPMQVDALQYSLGEGPCVAALSVSDLVWVEDLASDTQFPRFAPRAVLMAQQRWTQSEAFDRLVQASQHLNRRLHDIAAEVSRTRKLPPFHA